jgi:hypothetical protein
MFQIDGLLTQRMSPGSVTERRIVLFFRLLSIANTMVCSIQIFASAQISFNKNLRTIDGRHPDRQTDAGIRQIWPALGTDYNVLLYTYILLETRYSSTNQQS